MNAPIDQPQRTRFITETARNFSVIASAGSGKTRAITDRILAIALDKTHARQWLPSLVVVTFTNRAANEMQQRARQAILDAGVSLDVLAAFNRAYFGTIHSFCVKLLQHHGHHLGLPARFDLLTDDSALWNEFVQTQTVTASCLSEPKRRALLRFVSLPRLMLLARRGGAIAATQEGPGECPDVCFDEVLRFAPDRRSLENISRLQGEVREWIDAWSKGDGFAPLPVCTSVAKEFVPIWCEALDPIRAWVRCCSLKVAAEIEHAYRTFRQAKGALTYDDQVALARELLQHPEAARQVRAKNYRVILDEAQDTDPEQFGVLLESTRPLEARGAWLEEKSAPPRAGHFCMVGDFQQSIFGDRADLTHYRRVHEALLTTGGGEALEFSVTFRLDQRQIDFLNVTFETILSGTHNQVSYLPLQPRPQVLPGQMVRFELGPQEGTETMKEWQRAQVEARQLARWLREQGLARLRAERWSDVAILCPRKAWFRPLRDALRAEGIEVQVQSERDIKGDSPAYAWLSALAVVMAEPRDAYELVGVLREVFGHSDHDLAEYSQRVGERFQIAEPNGFPGPVAETLNHLATTRVQIIPQPLFTAMQTVVQAVELRARLTSLPESEFENLAGELDELLTLAAAAEAQHQTLTDFAESLRAGFSEVRETRNVPRDAVQLITCHKAKGSEWQVVVLPFFSRPVATLSPRYPQLIRDPRDSSTYVALEKEDITAELKQALDLEAQQEMERLLYVAVTRARHTLVIAHDHELFADKKGVPKGAQTRLLRTAVDEVNAPAFAALPATATACAVTAMHQLEASARRAAEEKVEPLAPAPPNLAGAARTRAAHFIKRNPSALAEPLEDSGVATPPPIAGKSSGVEYGIWWHALAEQLVWNAGISAWEATFATAVRSSPDATLSRREWALLLRQLTPSGELGPLLTRPELIVHAEMPFLWEISEGECLEGIIDLAVYDPGAGTWLVLDWKTNRLVERETAHLHEQYGPQLAAYWKAVSAMVGAPVAAGIYSTAAGTWLPFTESQLADTWDSLSRDPAAISAALAAS